MMCDEARAEWRYHAWQQRMKAAKTKGSDGLASAVSVETA